MTASAENLKKALVVCNANSLGTEKTTILHIDPLGMAMTSSSKISYVSLILGEKDVNGIFSAVDNVNPFEKYGDIPAIKINAMDYKERMEECKFSLIAQTFLAKGL